MDEPEEIWKESFFNSSPAVLMLFVRGVVNMGKKQNKKTKKRMAEIRKRIAKLKQQLKGEKEQPDDPGLIWELELDISKLQEQLKQLEPKKR